MVIAYFDILNYRMFKLEYEFNLNMILTTIDTTTGALLVIIPRVDIISHF